MLVRPNILLCKFSKYSKSVIKNQFERWQVSPVWASSWNVMHFPFDTICWVTGRASSQSVGLFNDYVAICFHRFLPCTRQKTATTCLIPVMLCTHTHIPPTHTYTGDAVVLRMWCTLLQHNWLSIVEIWTVLIWNVYYWGYANHWVAQFMLISTVNFRIFEL